MGAALSRCRRAEESEGVRVSSSAPSLPWLRAPDGSLGVRSADLVRDWALVGDAARLCGLAGLSATEVRRYWQRARAGSFHPDEFAQPAAAAALASSVAQEPAALLGAAGAAPLGYLLSWSPGGAAASAPPPKRQTGRRARTAPVVAVPAASPSPLLLCVCCGAGTLDALAVDDTELVALPIGRVSAELAEASAQLLAELLHRLRCQPPGQPPRQVLFTGHGMGAAVAAVAACQLAALQPGFGVWHIGFGCPKPGDAAFAQRFAECVGLRLQLRHGRDCVPKLPAGVLCVPCGTPLHLGRADPQSEAVPVMSDGLADHALHRYIQALAGPSPHIAAIAPQRPEHSSAFAMPAMPAFPLEMLPPDQAFAALASESMRLHQSAMGFWGGFGGAVGGFAGDAVNSVNGAVNGAVAAAAAAVPPPSSFDNLLRGMAPEQPAPAPAPTPPAADECRPEAAPPSKLETHKKQGMSKKARP